MLCLLFVISAATCPETPPTDTQSQLSFLSSLIPFELTRSTQISRHVASVRHSGDSRSNRLTAETPQDHEYKCHPQRIFFGMVDYHSAVHAHWALLRLARYYRKNGNNDMTTLLVREVQQSPLFSCPNILGKIETEGFPIDELPYGYAWYLALLREWKLYQDEFAASRNLESEFNALERDLEGIWNLRSPNPVMTSTVSTPLNVFLAQTARDMSNRLFSYFSSDSEGKFVCNTKRMHTGLESGYHNAAWALVHWYRYLTSESSTDTTVQQQLRLCQECVTYALTQMGNPDLSFTSDENARDFFSSYGNLIYLALKSGTIGIDELIDQIKSKSQPFPPTVLRPTTTTSHRHAINFSRAWAMKAMIPLIPDHQLLRNVKQSFESHISHGITSLWEKCSDFGRTHWIGQFAVFALTEGEVEE